MDGFVQGKRRAGPHLFSEELSRRAIAPGSLIVRQDRKFKEEKVD